MRTPILIIALVAVCLACATKTPDGDQSQGSTSTNAKSLASSITSVPSTDGIATIEDDTNQYKSFVDTEWHNVSNSVADVPGFLGVYILTEEGEVSPTIDPVTPMANGLIELNGHEYLIYKLKVVFIPNTTLTKFKIDVKSEYEDAKQSYSFKQEFADLEAGKAYTFTFGERKKLNCGEIELIFQTEDLNTDLAIMGYCGD